MIYCWSAGFSWVSTNLGLSSRGMAAELCGNRGSFSGEKVVSLWKLLELLEGGPHEKGWRILLKVNISTPSLNSRLRRTSLLSARHSSYSNRILLTKLISFIWGVQCTLKCATFQQQRAMFVRLDVNMYWLILYKPIHNLTT